MTETKRRVAAFRVELKCSQCDGHMEYTPVMLPTSPAQYPHRCDACGHSMILPMTYPYIEFVEETS